MAIKPNGVFGKDVQVFVDESVTLIKKGDLVGITEQGTGVLASTDGTLGGTTQVVGQANVEFDNELSKQLFYNYSPDHRYLSCETQVVTYLNAETGIEFKPGDLVYLSQVEDGKVSNVAPAEYPTTYDAAQALQASQVNEKALVGVALSKSVDGQVLVSMNK